MKKHLFIISALIMGLVSCQKEQTVSMPDYDSEGIPEMNYTVLEEKDLTSEELFASAAGLEEFTGPEAINSLQRSFNEAASNQIAIDGTKASLPALFYKTARVTYTVKDEAKKDVVVSALIVYPALRKMDKVLVINHCTHIGCLLIPTNYTSVEAIMAASGALCILPDYVGIGQSSTHCDYYLNAEVNGRTSVNALFTLLDYAKKKNLSLSKDYKTYVAGYSQGGAVSLATLRQIQKLNKTQQKQINLKKVICGDGPYDLRATFDQYVKEDKEGLAMGLGAVIPMVINGMFCSYPKEMGKFKYEDFFTEWALSTGVPQAVKDNDAGFADMLMRMKGAKLSDILNMDYIKKNPKAYETLLRMMDKQNLCKGWTPVYPLKFFHCNPDRVVPYSNLENVIKGLQNKNVETPDVVKADGFSNPIAQHLYGMTIMIERFLAGRYY